MFTRIFQAIKRDHTRLTPHDRHALDCVSAAIQALKAKATGIRTEPPKPQHITVKGDKQP